MVFGQKANAGVTMSSRNRATVTEDAGTDDKEAPDSGVFTPAASELKPAAFTDTRTVTQRLRRSCPGPAAFSSQQAG